MILRPAFSVRTSCGRMFRGICRNLVWAQSILNTSLTYRERVKCPLHSILVHALLATAIISDIHQSRVTNTKIRAQTSTKSSSYQVSQIQQIRYQNLRIDNRRILPRLYFQWNTPRTPHRQPLLIMSIQLVFPTLQHSTNCVFLSQCPVDFSRSLNSFL